MTMKKIYIRPEMTIIELETECGILAGSTEGDDHELELDPGTTLPGGSFNSKNHNFSIWDDEDF